MKRSLLNTIMILALLAFSSCLGNDPAQMIWEFADYDRNAVTAVYAPDYYTQVSIAATADYSGDMTLRCTNYPQLIIEANRDDGTYIDEKAGFAVSKVDNRTLKVTFMPTADIGESGASVVGVKGLDGKDRNITNMSIGRIPR